jgi:hypothetical protein
MGKPFLRSHLLSTRECRTDQGGRPDSLACWLTHSCGTAPDLHRLRHYAFPSGGRGTLTNIYIMEIFYAHA